MVCFVCFSIKLITVSRHMKYTYLQWLLIKKYSDFHLSWIWLGTHSGRETKGQLKSVLGTHLVQGSDLDTPVLMHINRTAFSFRCLSRRVNQQLAFPDMVPGRTTFAKWLAVSANVKCEWARREWTKHMFDQQACCKRLPYDFIKLL